MKRKTTKQLLLLLLLAAPAVAWAQKLALEKTYQITGQAKRGYLDDVQYDQATGNTVLYFVTRESTNITGNKSKVKYQIYHFDKEYNFIKMEEKIDEYRNKRYKGDNYSVEGVSMENNLVGTFVLRRKLISYTWNWFFGGYNKKVKLLEKVKPKDEMGAKYSLLKKFENDETGEVIALVKTKPLIGKKAALSVPNEYNLLRVNKNLDFVVTETKAFEKPQAMAAAYLIASADSGEEELSEDEPAEDGPEADDDQGNIATNDAAFVFAPSFGGGKTSDPHDYTYWRVNNEGKILEIIPLKTAASIWNINQAIANEDVVFLGGPSNDGKFFDNQITPGADLENMKWKSFQLCKISNGKVDYMTLTSMDEFEAKLMAPPSQKKSPSYRGKKFHYTTSGNYVDGSIMACGQNYDWATQNKVKMKQYKDVVMFYFDPQGHLKAQYGVRREENNKWAKQAPAQQGINIGRNSVYWTVYEMDGVRTEQEGKVKAIKALLYPSVARIDPASGAISDFVQFGLEDGKPRYYLHNAYPILQISPDWMVYLGADKPGKVLWFGKVMLE
jgi:hypothetical protein